MEDSADNAIIRLFHVHKRYGPHKALTDISLDIPQNAFIFITGPSGAGKTTLLKLLYLGESASEGQILINGVNLSRIPRKRVPFLRRDIGIIFQDFKLLPAKTVFENISLVLEAAEKRTRFIKKKVASVLRTVSMEDRRDAYPPSLSGGEQQRIAAARAIVNNPLIILADEPTGSLDPESAESIIDILKKYHATGATVIIATHDQNLIQDNAGPVIRLEKGRLEGVTALP